MLFDKLLPQLNETSQSNANSVNGQIIPLLEEIYMHKMEKYQVFGRKFYIAASKLQEKHKKDVWLNKEVWSKQNGKYSRV